MNPRASFSSPCYRNGYRMAAFTSIQKTALVSAHRPGAQGIECTAQPIARKMSVRMSIGPEIRIERPLGAEAHPAKAAIVSNRSHKASIDHRFAVPHLGLRSEEPHQLCILDSVAPKG